MTGTERKRIWRIKNPERSAVYECERAQRRRDQYLGRDNYNSYQRYERRRKAKRIESWDPLFASYLRGEITLDEACKDLPTLPNPNDPDAMTTFMAAFTKTIVDRVLKQMEMERTQ